MVFLLTGSRSGKHRLSPALGLAVAAVLGGPDRAVLADPLSARESVQVPGVAVVPTIDGQLAAGEWSAAAAIEIGVGAGPVTLHLAHRGVELFVAVEDTANPSLASFDRIVLHFDDEGGVPPLLADGAYANPACGPPNSGEGVYILVYQNSAPLVVWEEWITGPAPCGFQFGGSGVAFALDDLSGHLVYEAALPIDGRSAIVAAAGQTFGFYVWTYDSGASARTGDWPAGATVYDPGTYAQLTLDNLLFADGFESAAPDWWSAAIP